MAAYHRRESSLFILGFSTLGATPYQLYLTVVPASDVPPSHSAMTSPGEKGPVDPGMHPRRLSLGLALTRRRTAVGGATYASRRTSIAQNTRLFMH